MFDAVLSIFAQELDHPGCEFVGGVFVPDQFLQLGIIRHHPLMFTATGENRLQLFGRIFHIHVVLQQLPDSLSVQNQVNQRNVRNLQKGFADQHRRPIATIADNLRYPEQCCLQGGGAGGDNGCFADGQKLVGFIADVTYITAL